MLFLGSRILELRVCSSMHLCSIHLLDVVIERQPIALIDAATIRVAFGSFRIEVRASVSRTFFPTFLRKFVYFNTRMLHISCLV